MSSRTDHEESPVTTMKKLDHARSSPSSTGGPETDMSQPGIEPRPVLWEASTLKKSHSNSLLKTIGNIYI
jgi:hypothetical protein